MTVDQVEQREQKNPDNIDEVPIESCQFDVRMIFPRELSFPRLPGEHEQQADSDNHMQRMESGHREVEPKIHPDMPAKAGILYFLRDLTADAIIWTFLRILRCNFNRERMLWSLGRTIQRFGANEHEQHIADVIRPVGLMFNGPAKIARRKDMLLEFVAILDILYP